MTAGQGRLGDRKRSFADIERAQKFCGSLSHLFTLSDELLGTSPRGRGQGWRRFHGYVASHFQERYSGVSASLADSAPREVSPDGHAPRSPFGALLTPRSQTPTCMFKITVLFIKIIKQVLIEGRMAVAWAGQDSSWRVCVLVVPLCPWVCQCVPDTEGD